MFITWASLKYFKLDLHIIAQKKNKKQTEFLWSILCCPLVVNNTQLHAVQEPFVGRRSVDAVKADTYHTADSHTWLLKRYGLCHHDAQPPEAPFIYSGICFLCWTRRRPHLKFILMQQEKGVWGGEVLNVGSEWKNAPAFLTHWR